MLSSTEMFNTKNSPTRYVSGVVECKIKQLEEFSKTWANVQDNIKLLKMAYKKCIFAMISTV